MSNYIEGIKIMKKYEYIVTQNEHEYQLVFPSRRKAEKWAKKHMLDNGKITIDWLDNVAIIFDAAENEPIGHIHKYILN